METRVEAINSTLHSRKPWTRLFSEDVQQRFLLLAQPLHEEESEEPRQEAEARAGGAGGGGAGPHPEVTSAVLL